jgi:hypothetical protein
MDTDKSGFSTREFGIDKKRIMGNGMKKIIGVLIISALVSCFGNDENGDNVLILSKRDRCENTVRNSIALAPRPCIVGLATLAGDVNFQTLNNLILIQCLNYQFEMKKCKSESDVLPP